MVKQGYKQTEIGVIPEDWTVLPLRNIVSFRNGVAHESVVNKNGKYVVVNSKFISSNGEAKKHSNLCLQPCFENDILMVMSDVPNGRAIAKCFYVDRNNTYTLNQRICNLGVFKDCSKYVFYAINRNPYFLSFDDGVKQTNLTKDNVLNCKIAIPTNKKEQECIAEALSDVDSMISSLEKLIAKKKAIKQGAMQELLTGKNRLPGFSGEWKIHKLDELLQYEQPTKYIVHSAKYTEQGIPVLTAGKSLILGYTTEKDGIYENLPVIIFDDFVASSKYIAYRFKVKSSAMKMLTLKNEEMNLKLIFELMQMIDFVPVDHQRHWISQYSQFEIKLPPTIEEQTAIASILANMDNEIEALEQKLEKTRQIKQGMMQQLLTGKIRLVPAITDNKSIEAVSKPHHNRQFDDAVMIAAIVNEFYNDTIPLGRKKVQKLLYLLRRKQEADTSAFKKKAAGPYADEVRYKGGEPIAIRSQYVLKRQGTKGTTFSKGEKIESALEYIKKWEMTEDIKWLASTFKYTKTTDLELFATIDMAMCDLINSGESISVESIKKLIASNKEWKDKLSKAYFSDNDIAKAISFCQCTFN